MKNSLIFLFAKQLLLSILLLFSISVCSIAGINKGENAVIPGVDIKSNGFKIYSNSTNSFLRAVLAGGGGVTSSLVANYTFCNNANDITANANNGTVNGATLTTDRFGNANSAYNFDGNGDFVEVADNNSLDLTTNFTINTWIYPTGAGSDNSFGGILLNKEGAYEIARFPNGSIQFALSATGTEDWTWNNTGIIAPINTWSFISIVKNGSTVAAYLNGVSQYTSNSQPSSLGTNNANLKIGGRTSISQDFQGKIDDVKIFDGALTDTEVLAKYNEENTAQTITCGSALPIRLIAFNGKPNDNGTELSWKTSFEQNFSHFEVERSTDAHAFNTIGNVKGNNEENYELVDNLSSVIDNLSLLYYRLKMVDINGSFDYSKTISIKRAAETEIKVYPNPALGYFIVENPAAKLLSIKLIDGLGREINSQPKSSDLKINISTEGINSGTYFIQIHEDKQTVYRKIIIHK